VKPPTTCATARNAKAWPKRPNSDRTVAGSEKAAAQRLGLSHSTVKHHLANARSKVGAATTAQLVWILAPRLPEPEGMAQADEDGPLSRRGRDRGGSGNFRGL